MTKHIFDGKRDCCFCGGTGVVPVPATNHEAPTEERCPCCAGTGLCDQARIAKLEAELAAVTAALAAVTAALAVVDKREDQHYRRVFGDSMMESVDRAVAKDAGVDLYDYRYAKLEATVKLLQRAVRKVYQDVPELWEEAL